MSSRGGTAPSPWGSGDGTVQSPGGAVSPPGSALPPPPWRSEVEAVLWWHRAAPGAAAALPAALAGRAGPPLTLAGLVHYRAGPVGPYRELFGSPVLLRGRPGLAHVAFMAVDSPPSVAGGRGNWALPKVLATFEDDPARPGTLTAEGEGWAVTVSASVRPRAVPAWVAATSAQVWPDGTVRAFAVRMGGHARLATVEVRHDVPSALAGWLLPGRHPAVVVSGRQVVGPPRLSSSGRGCGGARGRGRAAAARSRGRPEAGARSDAR